MVPRAPDAAPSGVRVLVVSAGQLLLVHHRDAATGAAWWAPPGGGREPGETFAAAARRELFEETGVRAPGLRRLRVPPDAPHATYALFAADGVACEPPAPTVDLARERLLTGAAWHPVTRADPLGPLDPAFWGHLAPHVRRMLDATSG